MMGLSRRVMGEDGVGCYHVVSRVVDRRFVFGDMEKAKFRELMERLLGYCGLEGVTFCLMSNHFHLLVVVPEGAREVGDGQLLERMGHLYPAVEVEAVGAELRRLRRENPAAADRLVARYARRMGDLSEFVRELKVRFSRWYNRRNGRKGTLWEERFRSVLVEERPAAGGQAQGSAVLAVAAYIDLNPVRAGLVGDPKDFRWSGYGEAVAGVARSREGLRRAVAGGGGGLPWVEAQAVYRSLLYGTAEGGGPGRGAIDPVEVEKVLRSGGRLSLPELLRCRVRYFSDGVSVGSHRFLEAVFRAHRERFGGRRRTGARAMLSGDWGGLMALRDLRNPVTTGSSRR